MFRQSLRHRSRAEEAGERTFDEVELVRARCPVGEDLVEDEGVLDGDRLVGRAVDGQDVDAAREHRLDKGGVVVCESLELPVRVSGLKLLRGLATDVVWGDGDGHVLAGYPRLPRVVTLLFEGRVVRRQPV